MENHPIPQDVTGFKFKLIGSVTIKQFLYLLAAGILTVLVFMLPINIFIKIPLMTIFSLVGLGLAFVPIEGRPMDLMIVNFAKTIPSENRYIYQKKGANLSNYEFLKPPVIKVEVLTPKNEPEENNETDSKREILLKRLRNSSFKPDAAEQQFFNSVKSYFDEKQTVPEPQRVQTLPDKLPEEAKPVELPKEVADETPPITEEKIEAQQPETQPIPEHTVNSPEEQQIVAQPEPQAQEPVQETTQTPISNENSSLTTPQSQLVAGFPSLPDVPNVVLGIVKDPRGKVLPNILVEVVDANSVPVRAFKTNLLGQFASATPLPNGNYKIFVEDPQKKNEFEQLDLSLVGEICNPLEITSVDAREKLRRELFEQQGGAQAPVQPAQ